MVNKPLILVIDDEIAILQTLKIALEEEGYLVETVSDGSKVLETIGKLVPDLILLDIFLPKYNGIELLTKIKHEYPVQHVIMMSGFGTISIAIDSLQKGAINFIEKPLNLDEILAKINFTKNTNNTTEKVKSDFYDDIIIGSSSLFNEFLSHAKLIAPLNLPVVIYGPHGSGKSLFAQYVHKNSSHSQSTLTTVSCTHLTELPEDLLKKSGTVFFKNIQELSHQKQQELLSHIESKATKARILASSTPNLFSLVQQGLFNTSLFCKLNQTPLEIASINKRRYDIPLLVNHFIKKHNKGNGVSFTPEALRALRNYTWSGDVAQLEHVVLVCIKSQKSIIDLEYILTLLPEQSQNFLGQQLFYRFNSLQQATNAFQQKYLSYLLKTYRYDTQQLAEFLQIPVDQLRDKMIQLEIVKQ